MRRCATLWVALSLVTAAAGCSRQLTADCEPTERYSTARSIAPVQIPDDLSPPDEGDALRLPPAALTSGAAPSPSSGCLESPPSFFRDRTSSGRPIEREASPESPAEGEPAAVDGERVIDN
jgi:hypothetical protein